MEQQSFTVTYDGEALRDGRMSFRDLATALLAVGKAIEEGNRVLNGDRVTVVISVKAVTPGSCTIDLICSQPILRQMINMFAAEDVVAIISLLNLLGFTAWEPLKAGYHSLLRLLKFLRGRRIKSVTRIEDGKVELAIEDGTTISVDAKIVDLYRDLAVRRALTDMMRPLETEGVDVVTSGSDGVVAETITKADLPAFAPPEIDDEPLLEEERRAVFSIVSLAFKDANKWRLFDGQNPISVLIADQDFLDRVDANEEVFAKGDLLVCQVTTRQARTASGLKTEHTVTRVIEHRSAARQLSLPLSEES